MPNLAAANPSPSSLSTVAEDRCLGGASGVLSSCALVWGQERTTPQLHSWGRKGRRVVELGMEAGSTSNAGNQALLIVLGTKQVSKLAFGLADCGSHRGSRPGNQGHPSPTVFSHSESSPRPNLAGGRMDRWTSMRRGRCRRRVDSRDARRDRECTQQIVGSSLGWIGSRRGEMRSRLPFATWRGSSRGNAGVEDLVSATCEHVKPALGRLPFVIAFALLSSSSFK